MQAVSQFYSYSIIPGRNSSHQNTSCLIVLQLSDNTSSKLKSPKHKLSHSSTVTRSYQLETQVTNTQAVSQFYSYSIIPGRNSSHQNTSCLIVLQLSDNTSSKLKSPKHKLSHSSTVTRSYQLETQVTNTQAVSQFYSYSIIPGRNSSHQNTSCLTVLQLLDHTRSKLKSPKHKLSHSSTVIR